MAASRSSSGPPSPQGFAAAFGAPSAGRPPPLAARLLGLLEHGRRVRRTELRERLGKAATTDIDAAIRELVAAGRAHLIVRTDQESLVGSSEDVLSVDELTRFRSGVHRLASVLARVDAKGGPRTLLREDVMTLVEQLVPTRAARHGVKYGAEAFAARFDAAFASLDQASGGNNYVTLRAIREALPDVPRATFDAELSTLRRARIYTLDPSDGRHHGMTEAEREAGIQEGNSLLVYVARRSDAPRPASPEGTLEDRIRAAYLRVTGGELNRHIKLANLRAQLPGEPPDVVDAELLLMQQRGGTVLYPIDDPQQLTPQDDAAQLRVAGARRDLVNITRSSAAAAAPLADARAPEAQRLEVTAPAAFRVVQFAIPDGAVGEPTAEDMPGDPDRWILGDRACARVVAALGGPVAAHGYWITEPFGPDDVTRARKVLVEVDGVVEVDRTADYVLARSPGHAGVRAVSYGASPDGRELVAILREDLKWLRDREGIELFDTTAAPARPPPAPEPAAAEPTRTDGERWVTGAVVDRSGMNKYLIIVRAPEDPERGDIRKLPEELRDRGAKWRRTLTKTSPGDWQWPIWRLLSDGTPRTFNRIGVELLDKTADTLLETPPEEALWALVAEGRVEHTLDSPVYFRARAGAAPPPMPPADGTRRP